MTQFLLELFNDFSGTKNINSQDKTCRFSSMCCVVKLSREHIQGSGEEK